MERADSHIAEWYVIFTESKLDHWIYRIVDRKVGHVYAVNDLNDYQWLVVQPRTNMTETKILLKSQYPHIKMIGGPDAKIIKVKANCDTDNRGCLNWFNCVEQVKALLGIRSFWTLTPKQLYDGLLRGRYVNRKKSSKEIS